jgi:hypothetical protein
MGKDPLEDPRLRAIEAKLNGAEFDEAQRLLTAIRHLPGAEAASAYFSTRLLYQRGRLDHTGVAQRLREVLSSNPGEFPEAENMRRRPGRHSPSPADAELLVADDPRR